MKVEAGKFYKDSQGVIWKVNGSTKNITCTGVTYHCEKLFKNGDNYSVCSPSGNFFNGIYLVSEFNG